MNLTIRKEKTHLRETWLILFGIWGEAELILRNVGARQTTFRELRNFFFHGIGEIVISRKQGNTDLPWGLGCSGWGGGAHFLRIYPLAYTKLYLLFV